MTMDFQNPTKAQIMLHEFAYVLMASFYARFARGLNLAGDERVLELGSGGGGLSKHLLRHLTEGGSLTCVDTSAAWMDRARRRLAKARNVEFHCGDLAQLDIPDASHDVAVIHLMLHDVPAEARQPLVSALARTLTPAGRVVIRAPIGSRHSFSESEIHELMGVAGLHELSSNYSKNLFMGKLYQGVFRREGT